MTSASVETFADLWPAAWRPLLLDAAFTLVAARGNARRFAHAALNPPPAPSASVLNLFGCDTAPSPEATVEACAREANEEKADVWFGVAARVTGLDGFHQGRKDQLVALPGFWLDLDIGGAGHVSQKLPTSLEVVVDEYLRKIPIEPTRVHATGGGIHCFWLLDAPIIFATATREGHSLPEIQALAKRWQAQFINIGIARGEHVDDTSDITRILRLPGTANWKTGAARPVTVLAAGGERYSLDQIRAVLKDVEPLTVGLGAAAPSTGETPGIEPWSPEETLKELPKRLRVHAAKRPERAAVINAFLDGQSYSTGGEHHVVRQRLVSWIAWLSEGRADVGAVCELNSKCYEQRGAPGDAFEKFEAQLTAALAEAATKIAVDRAQQQQRLDDYRNFVERQRRERVGRRLVP